LFAPDLDRDAGNFTLSPVGTPSPSHEIGMLLVDVASGETTSQTSRPVSKLAGAVCMATS
jgi:hypothetical protein